MVDDEAPPPEGGGEESAPSEPSRSRDTRRRRLEGVIPEIVRRAVEIGVEKAQEAPDNLKQFASDLKVPKDIGHYLLSQIDETKNGLFRVVAKEIRDFLEHTNFAGEMTKILTTVQFEVNTTIRFTPNDGREKKKSEAPPSGGTEAAEGEPSAPPEEGSSALPKPEVKTAVHVRRDDSDRRKRP
jgi:hypothetical protein